MSHTSDNLFNFDFDESEENKTQYVQDSRSNKSKNFDSKIHKFLARDYKKINKFLKINPKLHCLVGIGIRLPNQNNRSIVYHYYHSQIL
jgi:hypothetical protein